MKRFLFCLVAMLFTSSGCSDRSPIGPAGFPERSEARPQAPSPLPELATIQGRVYARVDLGDPLLEGALVLVRDADGRERAELTDADGFYQVAMPPGIITITTSKDGYDAKTWTVELLRDTILNFGLTPK